MPESEAISDLMERASRALTRMDYLTCEELCLEALAQARQSGGAGEWAEYARILLPLQEARRQRRMIAAHGVIRLGTSDLEAPVAQWYEQEPWKQGEGSGGAGETGAGCIAVTHPYCAEDAEALSRLARDRRLHVEILFADAASDERTWALRSFQGPDIRCSVDAPPQSWTNAWLPASRTPPTLDEDEAAVRCASPADWFLDACEAMGDAALAQVDAAADARGEPVSVEALEAMLAAAPYHEILHQRLGEAAREKAREH